MNASSSDKYGPRRGRHRGTARRIQRRSRRLSSLKQNRRKERHRSAMRRSQHQSGHSLLIELVTAVLTLIAAFIFLVGQWGWERSSPSKPTSTAVTSSTAPVAPTMAPPPTSPPSSKPGAASPTPPTSGPAVPMTPRTAKTPAPVISQAAESTAAPTSTSRPPPGVNPTEPTLLGHGEYRHTSGQNADFDVPRGQAPNTGLNFASGNDLYETSGESKLASGQPEEVRFQGGDIGGGYYTPITRVHGPASYRTCASTAGSDRQIPLDELQVGDQFSIRTTGGRCVLLEVRAIYRSTTGPLGRVQLEYWIWSMA